ncbi:hypothetical protein [Pseudomonas plecoglossicida]|uniref:hypothetical protein n=1 Tax=Pseudomonas plecoglossicida TaxID=70775 RepID=UPI0005A91431|nr:hypothetical protein [Pseudomonas plecoglossicida]GLR34716.1 hypothetical protein GCM10011247_01130 [Pseudomonas plecoglossicida]
MSIDSTIQGLNRAFARLKQRQAIQQQTDAASSKPTGIKSVFDERSPALTSMPAFDLELYRIDIIAKAIAHIIRNRQKQ